MIAIEQVIIVEGKYDKIRLMPIIDAIIIETGGFSIFADKEKLALIKKLACEKGIIIMTDSDAAGFKIRNYISGAVPKEQIIQIYIPDIYGKEKRKESVSKEGKLGVEGIEDEILLKCFQKAGVTAKKSNQIKIKKILTTAKLYDDGLLGKEDSSNQRRNLYEHLNLPKRLSTSRFLELANDILTYEEYEKAVGSLKNNRV